MNDVDESDFEMWVKNPITVKFMEIMQENTELLRDALINIDFLNPQMDKITAYHKGGLHITENYLNVTFNQLFPKETEEVEDEIEKTPYSW